MSVVTLEYVKRQLLVTHALADVRLQELIDDAESECVEYLDRDVLPRESDPPDPLNTASIDPPASDADDLPRSIRRGILLIVQAQWEGKDADEMMKLRKAAEVLWHPFRAKLGA